MISLSFPTTHAWLELGDGVRVQVRPYNTAILKSAQAYATRVLLALAKAQRERIDAGLALTPDEFDLTDPDVREGMVEMLSVKGLARHGILAWEGVGGAATPENFAKLMEIPAMSESFVTQYLATQRALDAEGNASAPSPSGTSAAGATTATAAPSEATLASAESQL